MAVTNTPVYPQTITVTPITIVNADSTNKKTLYTAGANGSRIENVSVTNTDTAGYTLNIYITQGGTDYLLGTVSLPLSAGNTTAAPTFNLLTNSNFAVLCKDANGNSYLYLSSGSTLKAAVTVAVTAAKTVTFLTQGGDY